MVALGFQSLMCLLTLSLTGVSAFGPLAIPLLTAGSYTILARSGVSTVPQSSVVGNIGLSPASASALTGFSLTMATGGTSSASTQVVGKVYAADYSSHTPAKLTQAVADMHAAFTNGNSRILPDYLNLAAGLLTSKTLSAGLYKWTTGVTVTTALTLVGTPLDVFIFQVAGNLLYSSSAQTILVGVLPSKVFWVVSGSVSLGSSSSLQGIILGGSNVALITGASVTGRILSQTSVTLQKSTVMPSLL